MSWIENTAEYFGSLRLWDLELDEAYLNITSNIPSKELYLYGLAAECDKCPFTKLAKITSNESVVKIDTSERLEFKFFAQNKGKYVYDNITDYLCHERPNLGEFGVYDVVIGETSCQFRSALEPVNPALCKEWRSFNESFNYFFLFSISNDCCHVNHYRFRFVV